MPQVVITLSTLSTRSARTARSPVTGFRPPFARVPAISEVPAVDRHRALLEVELERRIRVAVHDLEVAQHVPDRAVAVARRPLGLEDRRVDREPTPGVGRVDGEEPLEPVGLGAPGD